jgi:hypothetical protein
MGNKPTSSSTAKGSAGKKTGARDPQPGAAVKGGAGATAQAAASNRAERRPELIKKRREELRKKPARSQKEKLYTRLGLGALAVILVAAIGYSVYSWSQDRDLNQIPAGVVAYDYAQGSHDDTFNAWTESPPVGGTHNNAWQTCAFYSAPIDTGHAVHSLEHGAIWITYRADVPQDQIDELRKLADDNTYILVSPYQDQVSPIVATSWNHQLDLQSANDKDLDRFIRVFKNNRTYTPEYGASCTGVSTTIG